MHDIVKDRNGPGASWANPRCPEWEVRQLVAGARGDKSGSACLREAYRWHARVGAQRHRGASRYQIKDKRDGNAASGEGEGEGSD